MARVRCITEMGMGVDVHGKDATKAARRAVSDAIRHSSLGFFRMVGKTSADMLVDVTIGVPDPDTVDTSAVARELPYGTVTVTAVKGGLEIPSESGGDAIIIANAAVVVSLDDGKGGQVSIGTSA
ncbi:MAG: Lin0512 family protein [Bradyrhizobium sp.]|nr:Lin0512 family protein [Bradyrhizobium sp.]